MLKDCIRKLKNPDKNYRAIPFWSWNDKLEPEELKWQVREQKNAGLGGYFMHARGGLKTPYMGEEWFECIQKCVEEGLKQGIDSWLYDENGWPSGFADGAVPRMGVEYQQKYLKFEVAGKDELCIGPYTLGVYKTYDDYHRINDLSTLSTEEKVLHIYYKVNPYYSDVLNPKAVEKFIESTYDLYYERFKEHFGSAIPGIFTDEPQYGRGAIPWSSIIPEKFKEKYGYDIIDFLCALYYKTPNYEGIRYDYWNLVTELFTEGYAKKIGEWCEKHDSRLVGHVCMEENIGVQIMSCGSAMNFYQYMHVPGIDWLGNKIGNPVIVKQVSSVANQLGKKQVISEMFGGSGWSITLEELKWIAEWQYVQGVNLMCPHLQAYSLKGLRKRDWPPSLFYQSPWWEEYRKFNDYFSRLGMLLSEGRNIADILIIHPIKSGWIAFDQHCYSGVATGYVEDELQANPELEMLDGSFATLSGILSGLQFNYEYGDEDIIAKYGMVEDGKFLIGQCSYSIVIIPPGFTLDRHTIYLLEQFAKQGGKLFCFNEFPSLCQGRNSDDLKQLYSACIHMKLEKDDLERNLSQYAARKVRVKLSGNETLKILQKTVSYEDGYCVFIVNTDENAGYDAVVELDYNGRPCLVDLEKGLLKKIDCEVEENHVKVKLSFAPAQSYMLVLSDLIQPEVGIRTLLHCSGDRILLSGEWELEMKDLNAYTLDYCRYKITDSDWSVKKPVTTVQRELLELGRSEDIMLEYTFLSEFDFEKDREIYLVVEEAEKSQIEINGCPVKVDVSGWWRDKSFKKISIRGLIHKGENKIRLKRYFYNSPETYANMRKAKEFESEANKLTFDNEIESIYLLGDFSIRCNKEYRPLEGNLLKQSGLFYVSRPAKRILPGELTSNGYPFYSGSAVLSRYFDVKDIEKYIRTVFKMEKPYAALSKLYINGYEVSTFLWAPYQADISPYLKNGINRIAIELVSTNRNLLGSHHLAHGDPPLVMPQYFSEGDFWMDSYTFERFGLNSIPIIILYPVIGY